MGTGCEAAEAISNMFTLSEPKFTLALRFTPGAGLQTEKKMGPSAADVEAIKVWKNRINTPTYVHMHTHLDAFEICDGLGCKFSVMVNVKSALL